MCKRIGQKHVPDALVDVQINRVHAGIETEDRDVKNAVIME